MIKCGITGHNGNLGKKFQKISKKFKFIKFNGDISKKRYVENWIKYNDFDLIIHLASIVPTSIVNKKFKRALNVNYYGTKFLVDSIVKNNKRLKWFFFSSTSHVYSLTTKKIKENYSTQPSTKYGKTKLIAEKYIVKKLKKANIKFCIGRIFSIIDNKKKEFFLPGLLKKIKSKKKLIYLKNFNHYRDFISTEQICKIMIILWNKKCNQVVNIANGRKINLKYVAKLLSKELNKKIFFENNKPTTLVADIKKIKKLGYEPKKLNFVKYFY
jgi:UDP-glucose 4-epimerase|tara:strand:- start:63 stop:872 length:810 start_codon:yes stop_codon:yes gene_type:complete